MSFIANHTVCLHGTAPYRKTIMNKFFHGVAVLVAIMSGLCASVTNTAQGQLLMDGGFENYTVSSGGFVQPSSGPWIFANDAGVVKPFAPNSSGGSLNTWSATLAPVEGLQYASTYAALDSLRQVVAFPAAGLYHLSVSAAAPGGSLSIPSVGTFTLGDGEFTFLLDNTAVGSLRTVPAGATWNSFSADVTIATPGNYEVGVRNTRAAAYFINYDAFQVELVPEPGVLQLSLALGAGVVAVRALRRRRR